MCIQNQADNAGILAAIPGLRVPASSLLQW